MRMFSCTIEHENTKSRLNEGGGGRPSARCCRFLFARGARRRRRGDARRVGVSQSRAEEKGAPRKRERERERVSAPAEHADHHPSFERSSSSPPRALSFEQQRPARRETQTYRQRLLERDGRGCRHGFPFLLRRRRRKRREQRRRKTNDDGERPKEAEEFCFSFALSPPSLCQKGKRESEQRARNKNTALFLLCSSLSLILLS